MVEATVIRSSALGGSSISWGASTFELGPAGQPNAVSAIGQTISLTNARASSLQLLASAVNGAQSGTFTVNYSDGTSTSFTQSVSDWALDSAEPGESIVATMTYRNHNQSGGNGRDLRTMYLYGYGFALDPGKPVVSVTLPNSPNIKILAMNVVSCAGPGQSWEQLQPGRPDKRYGNHFGQP